MWTSIRKSFQNLALASLYILKISDEFAHSCRYATRNYSVRKPRLLVVMSSRKFDYFLANWCKQTVGCSYREQWIPTNFKIRFLPAKLRFNGSHFRARKNRWMCTTRRHSGVPLWTLEVLAFWSSRLEIAPCFYIDVSSRLRDCGSHLGTPNCKKLHHFRTFIRNIKPRITWGIWKICGLTNRLSQNSRNKN